MKMLIRVKLSMLAGIAAARASGECQDKNIRSMNCWIDQDPVLSIKGKAISRICWYPFSRDQRRSNFDVADLIGFSLFAFLP